MTVKIPRNFINTKFERKKPLNDSQRSRPFEKITLCTYKKFKCLEKSVFIFQYLHFTFGFVPFTSELPESKN